MNMNQSAMLKLIQSADVYILDNYDSKEVKDFLFEKLGINAKVYYIGE